MPPKRKASSKPKSEKSEKGKQKPKVEKASAGAPAKTSNQFLSGRQDSFVIKLDDRATREKSEGCLWCYVLFDFGSSCEICGHKGKMFASHIVPIAKKYTEVRDYQHFLQLILIQKWRALVRKEKVGLTSRNDTKNGLRLCGICHYEFDDLIVQIDQVPAESLHFCSVACRMAR